MPRSRSRADGCRYLNAGGDPHRLVQAQEAPASAHLFDTRVSAKMQARGTEPPMLWAALERYE